MNCTVKTYLPSLIASVVSGLACQYNVNHYFFLYWVIDIDIFLTGSHYYHFSSDQIVTMINLIGTGTCHQALFVTFIRQSKDKAWKPLTGIEFSLKKKHFMKTRLWINQEQSGRQFYWVKTSLLILRVMICNLFCL